jgi:predicted ATPase
MTRRPVSARVGAGIGKSRITAELEGRLHAELHIRLRYFCSPYHQDSALFPFVSDRSTKAVLEVMARGQRRFVHDSPLEGGVSCELVSENAKIPC